MKGQSCDNAWSDPLGSTRNRAAERAPRRAAAAETAVAAPPAAAAAAPAAHSDANTWPPAKLEGGNTALPVVTEASSDATACLGALSMPPSPRPGSSVGAFQQEGAEESFPGNPLSQEGAPRPRGPPTAAPLPRLVVCPPRRGELLKPFGRQRQAVERLFLKQVKRPSRNRVKARKLELSSHDASSERPSKAPPGASPDDSSAAHAVATPPPQEATSQARASAAAAATTEQRATEAHHATRSNRAALNATPPAQSRGHARASPLGRPSLPTQRVNQLDALRVNNEVVLLLQDLLLHCTRGAAPWLQQRQHELQLLLHLFLWAVSTARDRPTPGDLLQNVKYCGGEQLQQQRLQREQQRLQQLQREPLAAPAAAVQQQQRVLLHLMTKQQHALLQQQPLPWTHKLGVLLLHVLLPYLYQLLRLQLHLKRQQQQAAIEQRIRRYNVAQAQHRQRMQQQQEEAQQTLHKQQQQQQSRLQDAAAGEAVACLTAAEQSVEFLYRCCMCADLLLSFSRFCFFFYFLYRGRHRSLGDWLLNLEMRHIHPSLRRSLSFELLQQQLYWQSVSHVLLLLLPHIDLLLLRRMLGQNLLVPARAAVAASMLKLRLLLHKRQQPQQGSGAEEHRAVAVAQPARGLCKKGMTLLSSTKQALQRVLQDIGLQVHPLVTETEQKQQAETPHDATTGSISKPDQADASAHSPSQSPLAPSAAAKAALSLSHGSVFHPATPDKRPGAASALPQVQLGHSPDQVGALAMGLVVEYAHQQARYWMDAARLAVAAKAAASYHCVTTARAAIP
ncbi:pex2 pex12 amino terminal domain-containing protein [Cyclospora cayetanensis]|uniref:RING-type E3 ubiquitin transferase (cysteine targeting) n=1 Tax=Cyclospora cayetanensis TaxID=88456 RepID=A0A1D3CTN9_9EIME|nr:pex2 pex12 amino terminal domain-containing protein [Cyclospora cayetanensis]